MSKSYPITHILLLILTIIGAVIVMVYLYMGFATLQPTPHPHSIVDVSTMNNQTTITVNDYGTADSIILQTQNKTQTLEPGETITIQSTNYTITAINQGKEFIVKEN
jgi:hypothetical protein